MKRVCIIFILVAFILTSGVIAFADSSPQTQAPYDSYNTTDEAAEDNRTNYAALIIFLFPVFITLVGGSALYVLKRRRGENVTFFNEK